MLEEFLKDGVEIIYDEVNVCKALRQPTIELAKKYDYNIIAVVLPRASKKVSVNRRMKNSHGQYDRDVWNTVWTNFSLMYEKPTFEEGIDEVINYV